MYRFVVLKKENNIIHCSYGPFEGDHPSDMVEKFRQVDNSYTWASCLSDIPQPKFKLHQLVIGATVPILYIITKINNDDTYDCQIIGDILSNGNIKPEKCCMGYIYTNTKCESIKSYT